MTEEKAKQRLLILTFAKLASLGIFIAGFVNLVKPGWIFTNIDVAHIVGLVLMLAGLASLLAIPPLLKRRWDRQDKA